MIDYEDDYNEDDENEDDFEDERIVKNPQWRTLSPKERRKMMNLVFKNTEWYNEGTPFFKGGNANPMFEEISEKSGAPLREVKRYYSAWLNRRDLSPSEAMKPKEESPSQEYTSGNTQGWGTDYDRVAPQPSQYDPNDPMDSMMMNAMNNQVNRSEGNKDSMGMMFMMKFLTDQQQMAMQQSQFQMMQMMEQRKLDQMRESELRREQMARDQQFMNQQMTFMRDMSKKSGDTGLFGSRTQELMEERFVDTLLGEKDDSWKQSVKEIVSSDTVKAAVEGIGTAISTRTSQQIPAGYDRTGYDPYAQSELITQQPEVPQEMPPQPLPITQVEEPTDGVFFGEEVKQAEPIPEPVPEIAQFNEDEYRQILFAAFVEAMGPVANDPQVVTALQQQVDVAVDTTLVEMPDSLPQIKLQAMNEKLLLIRNLRDIGLGMMDLRESTPVGQVPPDIIISRVVAELRKTPEFYKIFADNTYDELMAKIAPFKHTGAVEADYNYLLKPESQEVCRPLLVAVKNDSDANGFP